jgi:hypothetical protein
VVDGALGQHRMGLFAKGGEGGLIAGVDSGTAVATASTTGTGLGLATSTTGLAAGGTATGGTTAGGATTATAGTTTGAVLLDEALVNVDVLLLLALTLALGLATGSGDEVGVVLLDELLGGPLLVDLGALDLADGQVAGKGGLLLGLLGEVVGVRDVLVLGLGGLGVLSILGRSLLQLGLGDLLTSLLVLLLGVALSSTPRLGSLLLRAGQAARVTVVTLTGEAATAA